MFRPCAWTTLACLFALGMGAAVTSTSAAEPSQRLSIWLSKEIIAPTRTLEETQAYCATRIPPVPKCDTLAEWEQHAKRIRQEVLERAVFRGEAAKWRDAKCKVEWQDTVPGGEGYKIRKLRYEALPGLWIPALLYVPDTLEGKVPVFLNVNGHDRIGKAAKYKQTRCINLTKRGILALNVEWLGMGQLNIEGFTHGRMNQLDLTGTSGLAPFFLAMQRGLDILLADEHADPTRVGVAGLSGGGWQTIIISSLDTRVTLANPVAGYSSFLTRGTHFTDLGDSEQTPVDLATAADYAHLTALMAPRSLLLTYNDKDNCCFATAHALPPLIAAADPVYKLFGKLDRFRQHTNSDPGTHNFEKDNRQALYRMIRDQWYAGQKFDADEIECEQELKTKEDLQVELPKDNADFHSLALAISEKLPHATKAPQDATALEKWQTERRTKLAQVVKSKTYSVKPEATGTEDLEGDRATHWKLRLDQDWTVPVVELTRGQPKETVIILADKGRKSVAAAVETELAAGRRVLAVDPWYFGECGMGSRDYLFALLISTIGDRPLGIQAGQISAIARWSREEFKSEPVRIVTVGPRSSAIALVATALELKAIGSVETRQGLKSLKEVLTQNRLVNDSPELFCFGLLEEFDMPQIVELIAPRGVTQNP